MKEDEGDAFTRHEDHDNYIWKIRYGATADPDQLEVRREQAPSVPTLKNYKLTFGVNKNLEITEDVKVVEAYMHKDRVTLLYKGLASYTFVLKAAQSMIIASNWFVKGFG